MAGLLLLQLFPFAEEDAAYKCGERESRSRYSSTVLSGAFGFASGKLQDTFCPLGLQRPPPPPPAQMRTQTEGVTAIPQESHVPEPGL